MLADLPVDPDDPPAASLPPLLVEGLPSILRAVPELDALLVMEGDACRWRDEVAPSVRRGIRNLARKIDMDMLTRKSLVMSHTRGEKWMVVGSGFEMFVVIWLLSVVALTWGGIHWSGAWGGLAGLLLSLVCGVLLPRLLIRLRNLFP